MLGKLTELWNNINRFSIGSNTSIRYQDGTGNPYRRPTEEECMQMWENLLKVKRGKNVKRK